MLVATEGDARAAKKARLLDESEDDYEMEDYAQTVQKEELAFEDLCGDSSFHCEGGLSSDSEMGSWGLLEGHVLARVFHFLRSDVKSLALASLTCKHWRAAVRFYKDITRQIDLSCLGVNCTDSIFLNIMVDFTFACNCRIVCNMYTSAMFNVNVCLQRGYSKDKINSVVLIGCTNINSNTLEEILCSFPCLLTIDIRGCSQFLELALKFQNVNWIRSRGSRGMKNFDDSHSKVRSLKQIIDKSSLALKFKGVGGDMDDFGDLKQYFDSVNKRDSSNQLFRRSLYKRSKLFDARKSSSILSRDARMGWSIKKSEIGYKRMEEFLASSLKDIMKENSFDFFVPKVIVICIIYFVHV